MSHPSNARYPGDTPNPALVRALDRAARSPFFSTKLAAAGIRDTGAVTWDDWLRIPPTTKEELRALPDFSSEVVIADPRDIVQYWRSGGVTGQPLFYPRTKGDAEHSLYAFAKSLEFAGVTADDVVMCSLPIGIHPAGQQIMRAAESLGAATIWAGAGNQTPSEAQIGLIHELRPTVWLGMASFGLNLAHIADSMGKPLADSRVRLLITTAEPLSPTKRQRLGELWGGQVVDQLGMSELTMLSTECPHPEHSGLVMWDDLSFIEVLDPETLEPVAPGHEGVLCITPIDGNEATPFIRWLSGDLIYVEDGHPCPGGQPRMHHSGRTTSFFKVKGVNLDHAELEDGLLKIGSLKDFRLVVTAEDVLRIDVECEDGADTRVSADVVALLTNSFGARPEVAVLARGTIAKAVESQIKAQRFVDERVG